MLMTESSDIRLSARNCLEGKVTSVTDGAVNAEVVIKLDGGSDVYSIVTREAVAGFGLAPGVSATAVIKASHIIWVLPDFRSENDRSGLLHWLDQALSRDPEQLMQFPDLEASWRLPLSIRPGLSC